jgi:hypothetical protein
VRSGDTLKLHQPKKADPSAAYGLSTFIVGGAGMFAGGMVGAEMGGAGTVIGSVVGAAVFGGAAFLGAYFLSKPWQHRTNADNKVIFDGQRAAAPVDATAADLVRAFDSNEDGTVNVTLKAGDDDAETYVKWLRETDVIDVFKRDLSSTLYDSADDIQAAKLFTDADRAGDNDGEASTPEVAALLGDKKIDENGDGSLSLEDKDRLFDREQMWVKYTIH